MQSSEIVDLHYLSVDGHISVDERTAMGETGVVDQHVNRAQFAADLGESTITFRQVGDVACDSYRLDPLFVECPDGVHDRGSVDVEQGNPRSCPTEDLRDCRSESSSASGDHHRCVLECPF